MDFYLDKRSICMNLSLLNSLCYTVGWFWCVLLGIHGQTLLAVTGALFLIGLQLYCIKRKDRDLYVQDLWLVIFSILLGILMELFFIRTDIIFYSITKTNFPPLWIICLYPLFALSFNHSLKFLQKNYLLPFLFGFLGAPLSYLSGSSLGGLTFPHALIPTWIILGICWGLFLCLLKKIALILQAV